MTNFFNEHTITAILLGWVVLSITVSLFAGKFIKVGSGE
jgi:hypothetical protein